jgi:hypothetical protein
LVLGFDVILGGAFVFLGYQGRKRNLKAIYAGMALYAADGLLFAAAAQWLAVLFHGYVLFSIWRGVKALQTLEAVEAGGQRLENESTNGRERRDVLNFINDYLP